ncbi:MAG: hypothetical protein WAK82_35800 [Streptosporangiaceae bacterium]
MFFLSRSRYGPFILAGLGVALIIFALADTTASRFALAAGGLAIAGGLATGIARLTGHSLGQQHRHP